MDWIRWTGLSFVVLTVVACSEQRATSAEDAEPKGAARQEKMEAAVRLLGFEDLSDWTVEGGTASAAPGTEGASALQVSGGALRVTSQPFSTEGMPIGTFFSLDLQVPAPELNPYSAGGIDVSISIPSLGFTADLGAHALVGLREGQFHTLAWRLRQEVREALRSRPVDVVLTMHLRAPGKPGPFLMDNLRFDHSPSYDDHRAVFGFDRLADFTSEAPLSLVEGEGLEGGTGLAVVAQGRTIINTRPVFTGGLNVSHELSLAVARSAQTRKNVPADVEVHLFSPSAGVKEHSLGKARLRGPQQDGQHRLTFAIPEDVRATLALPRTDLRLRIVVTVPANEPQTFIFDAMRFAPVELVPDRTNTLPFNLSGFVEDARIAAATHGELEFHLFPDLTVTLTQLRVDEVPGGVNISGELPAPLIGRANFSVASGALSGFIQAHALHYLVDSQGAGALHVVQLAASAYPREAQPRLPTSTMKPAQTSFLGMRAASGAEHDVLVLYTPAVEAKLKSNLNAQIQLAIAIANDTYARSGIQQRLVLAGSSRVDYVESQDTGKNLDRLQGTNDGWFDDIHPLRDRLAADLVVLLADDVIDACGQANLAWISSDADDDSAFAVVDFNCISSDSFTHELGHIAGAHHDWEVDWTPLPSYAHGYVSQDGLWRTVMAYEDDCTEDGLKCPRNGFFSTPDKKFVDGRLLGDAISADNTRRLDETAVTLEGFRLRGPRTSLYEGNDGTQDHVCVFSMVSDGHMNFTDASDVRGCDNDEARSLRLFDVPAGRVLRLFDSPEGSLQDDWVEIVVRRPLTEKLIGSLEQNLDDADVRLTYHRNDGLDGKVSRSEVASVPFGPMVDLHEGNDGTQNLVCAFRAGSPGDLHFPSHPECNNDEARSLTLYDVPAGTVLRFFDDPTGRRDDDWTEIQVKRDLGRRLIGTFEASFEDEELRVIYHRSNGLDGKVSRAQVAFTPSGPTIDLYEGNGGTQNLVCSVGAASTSSIDFQEHGECDNDEARSVVLYDVPEGTRFLLFDSPSGNRGDDWVLLETLRHVTVKTVSTFEQSFEDPELRVLYSSKDGLDGKVSRLEIGTGAPPPTVFLHEGNHGTQNLVCALAAGQPLDTNFQTSGECDNDEARSLTLADVRAGTVLRLYDHPEGRREDDWVEILVKRDLAHKVIGTFEANLDDADVRIWYHRNDGLDGKVSRAQVAFDSLGPSIDLYEGTFTSQNLVCSLGLGAPFGLDFQGHPECDNDEAQSASLYEVRRGTVILLYDSPSGAREDDWVAIEALRDFDLRTLNSFETTFEDPDLRVLYFPNNGLNGKVSRLEATTSTQLLGVLSFYEGNNGTQNKVCDVTASSGVVRFKSTDDCDNDEARSLMLSLVSAGTRIEVFDDPDCNTGDDWTEIEVKRALFRTTLGSFERSLENDDVRVVHHRDNGLDGKVSCIRVIRP